MKLELRRRSDPLFLAAIFTTDSPIRRGSLEVLKVLDKCARLKVERG